MAVMKHIKIQRVPQGTILFDQGEDGDRFYVVLKGVVGIEKAFEIAVDGQDLESKNE